MRLIRRALLLAALATAVAAPSGASAAGTGGIEVTPDPGVVDGHQVTAFHVSVPSRGDTTVSYFLRNTTSHVVSGQLYAASASRDSKGQFTIGGPGSAGDIGLKAQRLDLAPREVRHSSFSVTGPVHGTTYRAIVVEVQRGTITERAATVVYLNPGRRVPVPVVLAIIAAVLLAVVAGAIVVVRRRRTADPS